ncbi:hypothetical protein CFAM422_002123 [Trichoderma lentiforme]|uniref:Uncharacterized protein n=1 Tax=Trichoderma lentiforme TaxID=1567552 RepID=A0A9P4XPY4_9HYPO|nr:hypothetical protein CFAM422_002123 [Trichoderma lentiforme]
MGPWEPSTTAWRDACLHVVQPVAEMLRLSPFPSLSDRLMLEIRGCARGFASCDLLVAHVSRVDDSSSWCVNPMYEIHEPKSPAGCFSDAGGDEGQSARVNWQSKSVSPKYWGPSPVSLRQPIWNWECDSD